MKRKFRVAGRLDSAGPLQAGTLVIDGPKGSHIVSVRPLRRRRTYELPLSSVAEMIVARVLRAEVFAKRLERAAKRKASRKP